MENKLERFHQMESKYSLFEIGSNLSFPFWDMIRVSMYNEFIANIDQRVDAGKRLSISFLKEHLGGFCSIFKRNRIIIVCDPRYKYDEIHCFDRISHQLTEMVEPSKRSVIYVCPPHLKPVFRDDKYGFWISLFRLFVQEVIVDTNEICRIKNAFKEYYNIELKVDDLVRLYVFHYKKSMAFVKLLGIIKPKIIVCACDQQKHITYAGKKLRIPTYEMQHAGIMFDYLSYSYPHTISKDSNHAFADFYLMFGGKWAGSNNIPTTRLVIGNDYFCPQLFKKQFTTPYLVIISDCVHTKLLIEYTIRLSELLPEYLIIYKLHPSERQGADVTYSVFKEKDNINVILDEVSLWDLIKYMQLMVLVYSSSFFEASSVGKKIAVIKEDNYYVLEEFGGDNVFFVDNPTDIIKCLQEPEITNEVGAKYFENFNEKLAKEIINV